MLGRNAKRRVYCIELWHRLQHISCTLFLVLSHQRCRVGLLELGRDVQGGGGDRLRQRGEACRRARVTVEVVERHGHGVPAVPQEGRHLVLILESGGRGGGRGIEGS